MYFFFLVAVLYYATRIDLRLALFRDSIRIKPCTPKQLSPGAVRLERDLLQHSSAQLLPVWNIPDVSLSSAGFCGRIRRQFEGSSPKTLPIDTIIPTAIFDSDENPSGQDLFRIVSNGSSNGRGCFVDFGDKSIKDVWSAQFIQDTPLADSISQQSSETQFIRAPRDNVMSSNWTKPIIDNFARFPNCVVTLYGANGSGKSHSAALLSSLASLQCNRSVLYLNCKKLQKSSPKMVGILGEIDSVFIRSQDLNGAIIVFDDLDALCPNLLGDGENNASARMHSANPTAIDQSKLIADRISHLFESATCDIDDINHGLILVATCTNIDSLNSSLFRSSLVPSIQSKVPTLSAEDRVELLGRMIQRGEPACSIDFKSMNLSQQTEAYLPRDLEKISLRVARAYQMKDEATSTENLLFEALSDYTPLSQMLASQKEGGVGISWDNIGGLFDVKNKLESIVRHPVLYRRIYDKTPVRLPRGMMLYGPPGCGKSILPPALARVCNFPIVTVKGPEVLDKYIGSSEAKIRELFQRASQMAPSILFLDELEALSPRRGSDSTGVTDRVVNQLLTFLDGVEDTTDGTVYIIGATSRPDKVDPAVTRPGRLERHLYVGPPESDQEWADLMSTVAKQWNLTPSCSSSLAEGNDLVKIVRNMPRLCPADIRAAFDTAHLKAVHRLLLTKSADEIEKVEVELEDLTIALTETRASLNETEARVLDAIYKPFRGRSSSSFNKKESSDPDEAPPLKTSLR
jgi:peroxin-1